MPSRTLPCETFAGGHLDFSDGSTVRVRFNPGLRSRAVVAFDSRTVSWVKFTGDAMPGEGKGRARLNEFQITPTAEPYLKSTHGMSDVNFALVGYGVADKTQADSVWRYFKAHEKAFYTYNGISCPTWTTELPELYTPKDLNSINPDSTPTYAEYPAEYNATVVGETLLGISADVKGTVVIDPCVPAAWYRSGFGIENPGVLKERDLGYVYGADRITGWVRGKAGGQTLRVLLSRR